MLDVESSFDELCEAAGVERVEADAPDSAQAGS